MKKVILLTGAALILAGCDRSEPAGTATDQDIITTNDVTGAVVEDPALPTSAAAFVNAAAASDRFEIESSKLAKASASSDAVKRFADQMIKGHTESTAKLKALLTDIKSPLSPNDALDAEQQVLLAGLQGKSGAELDAAYKAAQIAAHEKTLAALNAYASGGDNPELVGFAKNLIPVVTAHLNMANSLK